MLDENISEQSEGQQPAVEEQQNVTNTENAEAPPPKTFTQEELNNKVQSRVAKEQRKLNAQIETLRNELEELKIKPKQVNNEIQSTQTPKREDFSNYEEYVEAKAVHSALQAAEKKFAQSSREKESEKVIRQFNRRADEMVDTGRKNFPDFDAVVNEAVEDGVILNSGPIYLAIVDSGIGDKIAYHLAKHPEEAERIQKLSEIGQIREIGKLEDKLLAKKEPRQTMEPVGGRKSINSSILSDDLPMKEFSEKYNKRYYS